MADVTPSSNQNSEVSSTQSEIAGNGDDESSNSNSSSTGINSKKQIVRPRSSGFGGSLSMSPGKNPSRTFVLNPSRLSNPFAKTDPPPAAEDGAESNESKKPEETPKVSFVPLGGDAAPSSVSSTPSLSQPTASSMTSFVFGQNIHEKVEAATGGVAEPAPSGQPSDPGEQSDPPDPVTNGSSTGSEMLFSAQIKKDDGGGPGGGGKTLSEAAREYEEARAVKRKFEEVQVITGEEEESNVLQINCKLFSWNSCSWVERGRGTLRVNDLPTTPTQHRLIVRTAGSLRVVLNTKIWTGMTVDRASPKSMRITGMDSEGVVKVFLLMASPKEMDQLQKCLDWRVNNMKKLEDGGRKKPKEDDTT